MKQFSVFLIFALLLSLGGCAKEGNIAVQEPAAAGETASEQTATVVTTAGEGISWSYKDKTLTLSGSGCMEDYELLTTPWDAAGYSISVEKLVVGEGIRYLGKNAFAACCNLEEVELPASLRRIGESCFADCAELEELELNEGLMVIENSAFSGCNLEALRFPRTLAEIGSKAFANCPELTRVEVNPGLLTVGENAFMGCDDLTVSLPAGSRVESALSDMGYTVASATSAAGSDAADLSWSGEGWRLEKGVLYVTAMEDYTASGVRSAPWGCLAPLVERVELSDGITNIGSYSFWGFGKCVSANLPEGVQSIGDYAFGACTALEEIKLPSTLKTIGYGSFSYCTSLTALNLPEGLESVGADAFVMCSGISEVNKPAGLKDIGAGAFNFSGETTGELVED